MDRHCADSVGAKQVRPPSTPRFSGGGVSGSVPPGSHEVRERIREWPSPRPHGEDSSGSGRPRLSTHVRHAPLKTSPLASLLFQVLRRRGRQFVNRHVQSGGDLFGVRAAQFFAALDAADRLGAEAGALCQGCLRQSLLPQQQFEGLGMDASVASRVTV